MLPGDLQPRLKSIVMLQLVVVLVGCQLSFEVGPQLHCWLFPCAGKCLLVFELKKGKSQTVLVGVRDQCHQKGIVMPLGRV
jgi:hypothetical protein